MVGESGASKTVNFFLYLILGLFALVTFLPFFSIVSGSLASQRENIMHPFLLWPTEPTLDAYRYIFSTATLMRSVYVTIGITLAGTFWNLLMTLLMAYPLAHTQIMGRKTLMLLITFTMLFGGGMIPGYLMVRSTGLMDSYLALIIPGSISTFYLILMKNFFQSIPASLEESARLDGANDLYILVKIIIPLTLPSIATFTLFYAVGHWNTFMQALLYLSDPKKWTVQVLLRQIVIMSQGGVGDEASFQEDFLIPKQGVKMAAIIVSTMPILIVYPFLQKYFVKGVMVGSLKG
jgi:putative aldouronate transport system permease protein